LILVISITENLALAFVVVSEADVARLGYGLIRQQAWGVDSTLARRFNVPWNAGFVGVHLAIAGYPNSPLRVLAGPGTGKTYALMRQRKRTKKQPEKSFAGTRCFKGLDFGDGTAYVDALRRLLAEKRLERQQKAAGKPN